MVLIFSVTSTYVGGSIALTMQWIEDELEASREDAATVRYRERRKSSSA